MYICIMKCFGKTNNTCEKTVERTFADTYFDRSMESSKLLEEWDFSLSNLAKTWQDLV